MVPKGCQTTKRRESEQKDRKGELGDSDMLRHTRSVVGGCRKLRTLAFAVSSISFP